MAGGGRDLGDAAAHRAGADDADDRILSEWHYAPVYDGWRFSMNALTPSR